MKTLEWKTLDWTGKNLLVELDQLTIGRLTFNDSFYTRAEYNSDKRKTKFIQTGFFSRVVQVIHNDQVVGQIKLNIFGVQKLQFKSGNEYHLASNFWGRNVKWIRLSGETLIRYYQPTMTSMRRGTIETMEELPIDEKDVLISSGLFVRTLVTLKFGLTGLLLGMLVYKLIFH